MNWWRTDEWRAYEKEYGDPPGTRAAILAAAPWSTRIVDLEPDYKTLWRGVRRSYHSLINKIGREYDGSEGKKIQVAHGPLNGWSQRAMVLAAQTVHSRVAGGNTRSGYTWNEMGLWIDSRRGLLTLAFDGTTPIGFAYFVTYDGWAYYFSGASRQRDLGLALIWMSMLSLKENGVRWAELGWQGQATCEKEEGIEFMKRGFGGRDLPAGLSGRVLTEKEWADGY